MAAYIGAVIASIYLMRAGRAKARRGESPVLSLDLIARRPSRAVSDCLLLRLPAASFAELAAHYPPVLAHLADLEAERS